MRDVRDCPVAFQREAWGLWFKVNIESHEDIREYAAFAEVEWQR
jgi:hypothetical protein